MTQPQDDLEEKLSPTTTPFEHIGLAFSGGGFRAASYALGVLSYLHDVKFGGIRLLNKVTYLSSASGGTITSACYALSLARGKRFGEFYKELFLNLEGQFLLKTVFDILNDDQEWKKCPHKQRNFINAFALAYDRLLFAEGQVGDLKNPVVPSHLDEVCFNTTDFYRGLLFRQQVKMNPDIEEKGFLFGNFVVNLKAPANEKLKIADLLAASSCFPAGFEPIIFPFDFINESVTERQLLDNLCIAPQELDWKELNVLYQEESVRNIARGLNKPIDAQALENALRPLEIKKAFRMGLMDGGITDNQGIESIMQANCRRTNRTTHFKPFDLMLINDVTSNFMDPFVPTIERKSYSGFSGITLRTIEIWSIVFAILGLIALGVGCFGSASPAFSKLLVAAGMFFLLVGGGVVALIEMTKKSAKQRLAGSGDLDLRKNFPEDIIRSFLHRLGSTPVAVIIIMLKDRFSSVLTLNMDVFLKRIRYLLYKRFELETRDTFRIKNNHVYDLSYSNDLQRMRDDSPQLQPNQYLQTVAQTALKMGTTLWFDSGNIEHGVQAALIACGQFTTCYNLLEYIARMKKPGNGGSFFNSLPAPCQLEINELESLLKEDYEDFKKDPFVRYNRLGKEYDIPGFTIQTMEGFDKVPQDFGGLRGM